MPKLSRPAFTLLAALTTAVCAPAVLTSDAHPHGPQAVSPPKAEMPAPVQIEIIELDADEVSIEDFDINEFLNEEGRVDVERLRAYEAGKMDFMAENMAGGAHGDHLGGSEKSLETSDLPPKTIISKLIGETLSTDTVESEIDESPIRIMTVERVKPKDGEMSEKPHHAQGHKKHKTKKHSRKHKKNRGRTITLSGETTVHIAPGGDVTITNNGEAIVPLKMAGRKGGKASAMIMDDGKPAKVTVKKTVKTENGKRKVHIVVDMESDAED